MKKRDRILLLSCAAALILGICAAVYPIFSAWYAGKTRSRVIAEYNNAVSSQKNDALAQILRSAQDYNARLYAGAFDPLDAAENGYFEELDAFGSGVMGYLEIPAIDVYLPIYHGTGDAELHIGAGHMAQSSLPVGGENTHAVIAAHTGQASDPLFSDLPRLQEGDSVRLHVLDKTLYYRVAEIAVVAPEEIDVVQVERGRDLVSLVTCYPFPAMTQRLIVTGERVPDTVAAAQDAAQPRVHSTGTPLYVQNVLLGVGLGAAIFAVLLGIALTVRHIRKHKKARG